MKTLRIFLLILIVVGIGLLFAQKLWVPKLVNLILESENNNPIEQSSQNMENWQTYKNTYFNFKFQYPQNFHMTEDCNGDTHEPGASDKCGFFQTNSFINKDFKYGPEIQFAVMPPATNEITYSKAYQDEYVKEVSKNFDSTKWLTINGIQTLRLEKNYVSNENSQITNKIIHFYFFKENQVVRLTYMHSFDDTTKRQGVDTFDQIARTFNFE